MFMWVSARSSESGRWRARWALAAALAAATTAPAVSPEPLRPHIVGHRGLEHHLPENTAINFEASLRLRLGIEVDVRRSSDGVFVCLHDETVDRTTDGQGRAADLTFEELRRLDAGFRQGPLHVGERIPRLSTLLEMLARNPDPQHLILLDLKVADENAPEELVELLRQHRLLDRVVFIGLTILRPELRARLRAASDAAQISVLAATSADLAAALRDPHANWAYLRFVPTAAEVQSIRARGMKTVVVGAPVVGIEPANWRRARDVGVDAIMTEYPLECRRELFFRDPPER